MRLVADPRAKHLETILANWLKDGKRLTAPALLYFEVTNALSRYEPTGALGRTQVDLALAAALALPIELVSDRRLHREALTITRTFRLPATYDAHYLALAERLDAPFWTADRKLHRAIHSSLPWVNLAE